MLYVKNILTFLLLLGACFLFGCHNNMIYRQQGTQPFVPVHLEFDAIYGDERVEEELRKRMFCRKCLFISADSSSTPYTVKIEYSRMMDLKSLGFVFLSAALAPIEAEFSYNLQIQILENKQTLNQYLYTKKTIENTNSAFGSMFNPFHKENGRSVEIFVELISEFLQDVMMDHLLPVIDCE